MSPSIRGYTPALHALLAADEEKRMSMSERIHVRPLRPNVPADNGAPHFLPKHGAVRPPGPFWERMRQIGAADIRELPARGARVMIRPVQGAKVLASGHRPPPPQEGPPEKDKPPAAPPAPLGEEGAEVEWTEAHESALADNLIHFPEKTKKEQEEESRARNQAQAKLRGAGLAPKQTSDLHNVPISVTGRNEESHG